MTNWAIPSQNGETIAIPVRRKGCKRGKAENQFSSLHKNLIYSHKIKQYQIGLAYWFLLQCLFLLIASIDKKLWAFHQSFLDNFAQICMTLTKLSKIQNLLFQNFECCIFLYQWQLQSFISTTVWPTSATIVAPRNVLRRKKNSFRFLKKKLENIAQKKISVWNVGI